MNGRWRMAAILLAVVLAGCGGDEKIKVESQQKPGPGDSPSQPILLTPDAPAAAFSSPGEKSKFFQVNLPAGDYLFMVLPRPSTALNDSTFQVANDSTFSTGNMTSTPMCCGPPWGPDHVYSLLGSPGTRFARVYAASPGLPDLSYAISVITGGPTGASIGGGSPASIATRQVIDAGRQFNGNPLVTFITHYYEIPAPGPGVYVVKITGVTGGIAPFTTIYSDAGYSMIIGSCATYYPGIAACIVDSPGGTPFYFSMFNNSGLSGSYDISVIGP